MIPLHTGCTVDESMDKEETLIPTLMIQPLAENAIWHGLMPKKGRKRLSIRFSRIGETICLVALKTTALESGVRKN